MTRHRFAGATLAAILLLPGLALAQAPAARPGADSAFMAPPDEAPPPGAAPNAAPGAAPGAPPGAAPGAPTDPASRQQAMQAGADQVVGLFVATCLRYPGDVAGLRGWVTGQGAPAMPRQASDAFLAGRPGQVFDVSYQSTRLALISLEDGGCEAVAEFADPQLVVSYVAEALRQAAVPVTPKGDFSDRQHPGVSQRVWEATLAGRQWVLNAVTAAQPPQASLGLHPFVAAQAPRAPR
ncbi:MAG: NMCC_0638 family (lipo)protein [Janthinobacterium lividum]